MDSSLLGLGLALLFLYLLGKLVVLFWVVPRRIQRQFHEQGVGGPPWRPVIGSLGELAKIYSQTAKASSAALRVPPPGEANPHHTAVQHALPHLPIWKEKYGSAYLYWYCGSPRLSITDVELIKEMTANPRSYSQSIQHPMAELLLGESVLGKGGDDWATHRKSLNPFFLMESLKGTSGLILSEIENMIQRLTDIVGSKEVEINIHPELEKLGQHVIAKLLLGSDAEEGHPIAQMASRLADLSSRALKTVYIPGWRFVPTRANRESKWLKEEMVRRLDKIAKKKEERGGRRADDGWFSLMLSSSSMDRQEILDDCRVILLAGSETTGLLLTWACVLLAAYPKWQNEARKEVHEVLGKKPPSVELLRHLKIVNMIVHETLRLYPPLPFLGKTSNKDMTLGGLRVPAGTGVEVPVVAVHYDREQWGDTADCFDPSRFADGVSKASKHPMAFMPFMHGPRICVGMNFGMMEAKMGLAMILQNFAFEISSSYQHEVLVGISLKPAKGANLLFRKI